MASSSAAQISRSIQHLLRRHGAAAAPALSALAGKSVLGRPLPVNPIVEEPVSAGGAASFGFSGRSLDMALFGRVDWPAMVESGQVSMIAKNRSDDDEDFLEDCDDDEFEDDEDFSDDDSDDEDEEEEEEEVQEKKPTRSKRS